MAELIEPSQSTGHAWDLLTPAGPLYGPSITRTVEECMKVDILEQLEDGRQRRIASFESKEGVAVCDNPVLWRNLMNATGGAITGARGKRFTPEDGDEYLRNLRFHFAGPYLFAGPPQEVPPDPTPVRKAPPSKTVSRDFSAATPRGATAISPGDETPTESPVERPATRPSMPATAPATRPAAAEPAPARAATGPAPSAIPGTAVRQHIPTAAEAAAARAASGVRATPAIGSKLSEGDRSLGIRTSGELAVRTSGDTGRLARESIRVPRPGEPASRPGEITTKLPPRSDSASGMTASGQGGGSVGSSGGQVGGASGATGTASSGGSSGSAASRARDTRPGEASARTSGVQYREQVDPEGIDRAMQERLYSSVYRLLNAVRILSLGVLIEETESLLSMLSDMAQLDLMALNKVVEAQEAHQELRFLLTTRGNYSKAWEKLGRYTHQFLEVIGRGELDEAMRPLIFLRDGALGMVELRQEWRVSHGLNISPNFPPYGTSPAELQDAWQDVGLPAFRRRGLSASLIDEIFRQSVEPMRSGIGYFQRADFGNAENALKSALRFDPGNLEARLVLGDILRRLDRYDEAAAELDRVIELETLNLRAGGSGLPRSSTFLHLSRARTSLGRALLGTGMLLPAIEQLERGLEALDQHGRRYPDDVLEQAVRTRVKQERQAIHRVLEPLYRAQGDLEKADHHRHMLSLP